MAYLLSNQIIERYTEEQAASDSYDLEDSESPRQDLKIEKNYKGFYDEASADDKYQCAITCAHFQFSAACRLLEKVRVE
jgi:hypothetical protein